MMIYLFAMKRIMISKNQTKAYYKDNQLIELQIIDYKIKNGTWFAQTQNGTLIKVSEIFSVSEDANKKT